MTGFWLRQRVGVFRTFWRLSPGACFSLPNPKSCQETPAGNFVADAMRLVTAEKTGEKVDFAFQAAGQIRQPLTPGRSETARGLISLYDLLLLCPLGTGPDGNAGYPVVSFYLTGEEVRRVLEIATLLPVVFDHNYFVHLSGLRYDYSPPTDPLADRAGEKPSCPHHAGCLQGGTLCWRGSSRPAAASTYRCRGG